MLKRTGEKPHACVTALFTCIGSDVFPSSSLILIVVCHIFLAYVFDQVLACLYTKTPLANNMSRDTNPFAVSLYGYFYWSADIRLSRIPVCHTYAAVLPCKILTQTFTTWGRRFPWPNLELAGSEAYTTFRHAVKKLQSSAFKMTVIIFLIDSSASMNQRTYLGLTLLDVAKGAVETFLKVHEW